MTYMSSQFGNREEKSRLNEIFKAFDKNNDGELSREELIQGYMQLNCYNRGNAEKEVDNILGRIDQNNSGSIDYSEFIMACTNMKEILTDGSFA